MDRIWETAILSILSILLVLVFCAVCPEECDGLWVSRDAGSSAEFGAFDGGDSGGELHDPGDGPAFCQAE